ncbi:hypothetical protein FK535_12000 [Mycolicibacterium sp. 018/SC-01/001]|uniref:hypothetical protein n=1 Tax=Mycolicibacterium sp. 018/SC-01/001 TaxID=2592069 RepID=UPI00117F9BA1|nr:hypothetical protein [Mycolicibacterium sp. 018/SC-01/001]TRW83366.1 hypothetical protein FK535_12000 [Mycolicibacterium sp. 018/SC-01/001]
MSIRVTRLWQRNVLGAIVVACALAVYCVIDFGPDWSAYRRTVEPSVVIGKGQSGSAGGETWRVTTVRHLDRSPQRFGSPLPMGTVLIVIDVDRSGTPAPGVCTAVITDGTTRWTAEGVGGYTPVPPEGMTSLCHQPGPAQFAFLLPGDVVPTALDVTHNGQITVRLLL